MTTAAGNTQAGTHRGHRIRSRHGGAEGADLLDSRSIACIRPSCGSPGNPEVRVASSACCDWNGCGRHVLEAGAPLDASGARSKRRRRRHGDGDGDTETETETETRPTGSFATAVSTVAPGAWLRAADNRISQPHGTNLHRRCLGVEWGVLSVMMLLCAHVRECAAWRGGCTSGPGLDRHRRLRTHHAVMGRLCSADFPDFGPSNPLYPAPALELLLPGFVHMSVPSPTKISAPEKAVLQWWWSQFGFVDCTGFGSSRIR